jgi:uncharacterized membrane protein YeiH
MEAVLDALTSRLVLQVIEAAAVIVSAIAGMIVASNKGMDLIGVFALASVNAFGGGTFRDLLLDNRPFYWMGHWWFIVVILAICLPFVYSRKIFSIASEVHRRSVKTDALGLALFTVSSTGIALEHDTPLLIATLMGVIGGTTGGVLRDVLVNDIPDMFRPGGLYVTASLAGAAVFLAGLHFALPYTEASLVGIVVVFALRMLSVHLGVTIPAPQWVSHRQPDDR